MLQVHATIGTFHSCTSSPKPVGPSTSSEASASSKNRKTIP